MTSSACDYNLVIHYCILSRAGQQLAILWIEAGLRAINSSFRISHDATTDSLLSYTQVRSASHCTQSLFPSEGDFAR